jgi:hypothetical protein
MSRSKIGATFALANRPNDVLREVDYCLQGAQISSSRRNFLAKGPKLSAFTATRVVVKDGGRR